jgi:hypothetical protein
MIGPTRGIMVKAISSISVFLDFIILFLLANSKLRSFSMASSHLKKRNKFLPHSHIGRHIVKGSMVRSQSSRIGGYIMCISMWLSMCAMYLCVSIFLVLCGFLCELCNYVFQFFFKGDL